MKQNMKTLQTIAAVSTAFGLFAAALPEARLAEIESSLPETPRADGAPAADRAKWDPLAATKEGRSTVSAAVRFLSKPIPEAPDSEYLEFTQNGNRTHYQKSIGRLVHGFTKLYQAECLEHKGRFTAKIVDYINAICALKSWTFPAHDASLTCFNGTPHVDLYSAHISLSLAMCISWLGDALPAAVREKVCSEIDRRTFQPYLAHARGERKIKGHWWFHSGNNWNSVCNSCVVRAALAIIPDRRLRAEFVLHAEGSVPYALAGYTPDGYCSEGMGYWNYGYGHHLMMGLSLRAATGGKVDLFADPKTKEVMKYAYGYQLEPGKSPHFADGGGNPGTANLALGRQIWPDIVSTAALKCPVLISDPPLFALRAFGQEPAPVPPTMDTLPQHTWFKDAQVLISRAKNEKLGLSWSTAFKGGHNAELHNHNDVGSYTIMMDGCEMCGDPGGEEYTRRTFSKDRYVSKVLNSYGHPVPVVGGQLQKTGRAAAAKVVDASFSDEEDSVTIEYASAYAVPALKSIARTVKFNRKQNSTVVIDKVSFSEPTSFEVPVITYRDWTKEPGAMKFVFKKSNGLRTMGLEVGASAELEFKSEEIENPGKPSPRRLAFSFTKPVMDATMTMTFKAN